MFEASKQIETTAKPTEPETTERTDPYKAGETYNDKGLDVRFVSAEDYDFSADSAPDNGYKVVTAYFEIKNNDSVSRQFGEKYFKCYADNKPADIWYTYDDVPTRFAYNDELSPGREYKGYLNFEVPESALTVEIEYQPLGGLFGDPQPVVFKVK